MMNLRDALTGKLANKGFAPVPSEFTDRMTFEGMGNGLRTTVMLPAEAPEPDQVDAAAETLAAEVLRQIKAL